MNQTHEQQQKDSSSSYRKPIRPFRVIMADNLRRSRRHTKETDHHHQQQRHQVAHATLIEHKKRIQFEYTLSNLKAFTHYKFDLSSNFLNLESAPTTKSLSIYTAGDPNTLRK
jgi:hypothetical protein